LVCYYVDFCESNLGEDTIDPPSKMASALR